jgi:hypothetical protein
MPGVSIGAVGAVLVATGVWNVDTRLGQAAVRLGDLPARSLPGRVDRRGLPVRRGHVAPHERRT